MERIHWKEGSDKREKERLVRSGRSQKVGVRLAEKTDGEQVILINRGTGRRGMARAIESSQARSIVAPLSARWSRSLRQHRPQNRTASTRTLRNEDTPRPRAASNTSMAHGPRSHPSR
jgi:hypothetical protein